MVHSVVQVDYRKRNKKGIFYPKIIQRDFFPVSSKKEKVSVWEDSSSIVSREKNESKKRHVCVHVCVCVRACIHGHYDGRSIP